MFKHCILLAFVVAVVSLLTVNCARVGHPEGGPRDTVPPVLLKTQPQNGATLFNKKRVRITFNEYVQLKDPGKQFLMSPPMEKLPTLGISGKSVVVKFNSPLKDSTTYLLNFGNAIADNNEGNVFPNYRFAFSTGEVLDSLRMFGLAVDAATGLAVENVYAYLYLDHNDSVVQLTRPNNLARSDKYGFFTPEYLKALPYKLVLLSDENRNYKYDIGQEAIGFFEQRLNPATLPLPHLHPDSVQTDTGANRQPQFTVRMFTEEVKSQFWINGARKERGAFTLVFNAPFPQLDSLEADSVDFAKLRIEYSEKHDTMTFRIQDTSTRLPDTLLLNFIYLKTDTLEQLSPSREKSKLNFDPKPVAEKDAKKSGGGIGGFLKSIVSEEVEEDTIPQKPAHWTLVPDFKTANISPLQSPTFDFSTLLFEVNPKMIAVEEMRIQPKTKDTSYIALDFELQQDTLRIRHYTLQAQWKEKTVYRYCVLPTAFTDVYAQTNDTLKGSIATLDPEKTVLLTFQWHNICQPYVLQITDAKGVNVIRQHRVTEDGKLELPYLLPATYRIKVIKDDNNNGRWDTGNYFEHLQPEYATFLKNTDGKLDFVLKANWEQELNVDAEVLFPEPEEFAEEEHEHVHAGVNIFETDEKTGYE